ncbi:MAG: SRPBCC family protein [Pseudomonadota bacterium]
MKMNVMITVDAPADAVWTILGPRYGEISLWCATVYSSEWLDSPIVIEGSPCKGRHCETIFGPFDETFLEYDAPRRSLYYEAKGPKLPFFVKRLTNRFTVEELSSARSRVTMKSTADMTQPFRFLMGGMMKMQMGKGLRGLMEELKHFAETGEPHPRKMKMMAKARLKVPA